MLKQTDADAQTQADSRRTSDSFTTPRDSNDLSDVNVMNLQTPMNHYLLGAQTFDVQSALNFVLRNPGLLSSVETMSAQNMLRQPTYSVPRPADLRANVQNNMMHQPSMSSNSLSKILNVLTREHQRDTSFSSTTLQE